MDNEITTEQLLARIDHLEKNSRFVQDALEMALSLGDFQENINERHDPHRVLQEAEKRTRCLIPFEVCAICLVNEDNPDITISLCEPADHRQFVENEMEFMTEKGLFAWALREKRGVLVKSKDQEKEFLLHVIATRSQIRGMFIGLLPDKKRRIPDASMSLLSLILLNTANAIESLESYNWVLKQNSVLEEKVEERTKELVKYERQLQRAQKMEAIGTLAGGVAHDLNNILSGLVSYHELLLMDLPEDSPLRKPVQTIKKSGEKAAAIVQDLLTLARRGVAATEVVNLNDVISEYLKSPEFEKLQFHHPEIQVETNLRASLRSILASPVHLSKTIMNLVSNAAEATPSKGKIVISTANQYVDAPIEGYDDVEEGDYITLTVSDCGTGISTDEMERIFEPFYTKKVMGRSGTGIGMAVVWGTVKDHNGYIDVQSIEGKGTTFTIYFPITRETPGKDEHCLTFDDYKGEGEFILVVDDVKEQRNIAAEMLRKLGYSVKSVSSGNEAVAYLKDNSADLLVLDMIMDPGIDGLETYKRVVQLHPEQKAVIASGFSESENVKEAQKLGAGPYIRKPYLLEKIGLAVRAELDK
ncbi:MAG: response regulator [Deltaproteobacteria bacterium]|nr:response regulator [Deltaproteobacteria bacterium]